MIRPLTCVCLILAAGSGLYLYQVKQRAFALDASLRSTFHDIDVARERTRMLRADWALVNDPERLQALASQYLTLQPMQPSQLLTMDQLAAALPPPPSPLTAPPASGAKPVPAIDPTQGLPMAEAAPRMLPHTNPVAPEVALLQPSLSQPAAPQPATPQPGAPQPAAPQPGARQPPARAAAAVVKPVHHAAHHPQPQPWLAGAPGRQQPPGRHNRQLYAANVPPRGADAAPRITPPAATVMYSAVSGSSLGMASSADLAPPRPLYSNSQ